MEGAQCGMHRRVAPLHHTFQQPGMRTLDLRSASMHDLFRQETENQLEVLDRELLALENNPRDPQRLEMLMRAAHSIKGAARILNLKLPVKLAHSMEDCFVAAQKGS